MSGTPSDKTAANSDSLLGFVLSHKARLLPGLVLACLRSLTVAPLPFFFQIMVDDYVQSGNLRGIATLTILIVGLLLLHYVLAIEGTRVFALEVSRMTATLRSQVFQKLQFIHFGYLDKTKTGRLLSKYAFDTQKVEMSVMPMVNQLLPTTLYSGSVIIILFILNWQLSLVVLAILPIYVISKKFFFDRMRQSNRENRVAQEKLTGTASEYISALRLVRGFGEEKQATQTMESSSEIYTQTRINQIMVNAVFGTFAHVSTQLLNVLVVAGGAWLVVRGTLTIGTLFAFLAGLPVILMPIQMFIQFSQQFFVGRESYHSLRELIDSKYVESWQGRTRPSPLAGHIRFENVTFSYPESPNPALIEVDLDIRAGEHVAFVGHSGSGKSTTANLVLGLYAPQQGEIRIDGVRQGDLDMRWLRQQCAIVMQESLLLSGSILDNIRFARWNASDAEVREAAERANALEFIEALPEGFRTIIGERGVSLSGGQRQRLSIARAILRDPRILILDEATSALDYESERLIQEALRRLSAGRTVITIAHRLSTIKDADRVVVLEKGRVVETGTFSELERAGTRFADLIAAQG
ncbi:MAG: ABC transporter ATP-binding protein [Verrucomicrobiota bacterium]